MKRLFPFFQSVCAIPMPQRAGDGQHGAEQWAADAAAAYLQVSHLTCHGSFPMAEVWDMDLVVLGLGKISMHRKTRAQGIKHDPFPAPKTWLHLVTQAGQDGAWAGQDGTLAEQYCALAPEDGTLAGQNCTLKEQDGNWAGKDGNQARQDCARAGQDSASPPSGKDITRGGQDGAEAGQDGAWA